MSKDKLTTILLEDPNRIKSSFVKKRQVAVDDNIDDTVIPIIRRKDQDGNWNLFMEENDTSALVGPPKSGKTNLIYAIVTAIKNPGSKYALQFKSDLPKNSLVALWNTEEKPKRVKRRLKQLSFMVNGDENKPVKGLMQFYLKGLNAEQKRNFMFETLRQYPEIRFGVLDHYGDIIRGYNDEDSVRSATEAIDNLMVENPHFSLLKSFHSNRTGAASNGVAGSFMDKKVDSQLFLEPNPNPDNDKDMYFSKVYMKMTRNGYFESFHFKENKNKLPKLIELD